MQNSKKHTAILICPEEWWNEPMHSYWVLIEDGFYTEQRDKCVYSREKTWDVRELDTALNELRKDGWRVIEENFSAVDGPYYVLEYKGNGG